MEWYNDSVAWSADGQSIYLTTRLPLDAADPTENEERKKKLYDVEVRLPNKEIRKIRTMDFQTVHARDIEKKLRGANANTRMDVVLEEDVNTPAKIYVSARKTREKALLLDLNPQFAGLEFGKVETVEWKAGELELIGGLYFPPDYVPGRRYPLVIQTHGFSPERFAMDGRSEWSSGFAARPLAAAGFLVLQVEKFKNRQDHDGLDHGADRRFGVTPAQSRRNFAMAAYEGAIDYLDGRGIIDRDRVGISGFSRTVAFVAYTLTHTKYQIAAAVMTDGITGGYFQNLAFPAEAAETNALYGGAAPFGEGIETWLKESPTFNLDKVKTPVRLVAFGPGSVLEMWEWFSGLSLQNKPVDFIEIPDGAHLLQKPWERRLAMQGMVDWFRFWLKGEEDPDPAKAQQYIRWRKLKKEHRLQAG
jgi:dipeptidyl aminopeptidase/acylaminoacyl peptidase